MAMQCLATARLMSLCRSNPDNLRQEIEDFNDEMGLPATEVPTKRQLAAAGRTDIMRAIAKFGGYKEVAEHVSGMSVNDSADMLRPVCAAVPTCG